MVGVYSIVEVADYGWGSAHTLGFGGLSIALLIAFIAREARTANPLLPLGTFRSRELSAASVIQALVVAGLFGFQFLSVLYLQRVLGYDALTTGLASVPIALVIGTVSLGFSARLTTRYSARAVLIAGLSLLVGALALLARAPADGVYVVDVLPAFLLLGVGGGLAFPTLMTLAMSGATARDAGLASGVLTTMTQVGGAFGLAVLATLATARTDGLLADGQSTAAALTGGYQLAFGIGAGLILVGLGLAVSVLRPAASRQRAFASPTRPFADARLWKKRRAGPATWSMRRRCGSTGRSTRSRSRWAACTTPLSWRGSSPKAPSPCSAQMRRTCTCGIRTTWRCGRCTAQTIRPGLATG